MSDPATVDSPRRDEAGGQSPRRIAPRQAEFHSTTTTRSPDVLFRSLGAVGVTHCDAATECRLSFGTVNRLDLRLMVSAMQADEQRARHWPDQ